MNSGSSQLHIVQRKTSHDDSSLCCYLSKT